MPSWPSAAPRPCGRRARARARAILDLLLRSVVVALELQRAPPVDSRRQRRAAHPRRLGPGHGVRRRRGDAPRSRRRGARSGARSRGATAKGVLAELLGGLLERSDVLGLLARAGRCCCRWRGASRAGRTGRRIVGGDERESAAEVLERGRIDVAACRVLAGAAQVVDRVDDFARALVVLGDQAEVLARAIAAAHDQPVGRQAMLLLARLLEHALVGDLVQHMVLEDELARALEGAGIAAVGQLASRQAVERGRRLRRDALQRFVPEHVADHARLLQRRLLCGGRPSMRACRTPASVDGTRTSSSLSAETRHGSLR